MYLPTFYKLGYEAWIAKSKRFMGIFPAVGVWAVWVLYPNLYNTVYTDFIPPAKGTSKLLLQVSKEEYKNEINKYMKLLFYDDWKNSASSKENMTFQQEVKIQSDVYQFARALEIQLSNVESSSFNQYFQKGISIFHRFAHQVSYAKFNKHIYITACLFLSAKDNDMFNWSAERYAKSYLVQSQKSQLELDGQKLDFEDPKTLKLIVEKIVDAESHILQMIGYDLNIVVPQLYFQEAKTRINVVQGETQQLFEIAQKFLLDYFLTNSCLYFEPKILALCSIYQASHYCKLTLADFPTGEPWYQLFNESAEENPKTMSEILEMQSYFDKCIKVLKN